MHSACSLPYCRIVTDSQRNLFSTVRGKDRPANLLEHYEITLKVFKVITVEAPMLLSRSTPVTAVPLDHLDQIKT
jgi:hypothetical protein